MKVEPQKEHQWLHKMIGEWTCEGEAPMEPDQPPVKWKLTESVRSLGGLWVIAEGRGEMPGGGESTSIMTLGYDPARQRFVGTFIASIMNYLWVYDGKLDIGESTLTLDTEGPSMGAEGAIAKYKDVIAFKSEDHRTLTSHMQGADGSWNVVMTSDYLRRK